MSLVGGVLANVGGDVFGQFTGLVQFDHPVAFNFKVEVDDLPFTGFYTVKGLSDRATPYKHQPCTKGTDVKVGSVRQPGLVTLEKCVTFHDYLARWYSECQNFQRLGKDPRRNVSIVQLFEVPSRIPLLGGSMLSMRKVKLKKTRIVDVTGPEYDALKNEVSLVKYVLDPEETYEVEEIGETFGQFLSFMQEF